MASNITRMPRQQMMQPSPQSGWWWDGSNWVCGDCDNGGGGDLSPFPPAFSGPAQQPPWYPGANGGVSFGTNAPQNPVRGHFWWDGATLWIFDGAAWVDSSTGVVFPGGGGGSSGASGAGTVVISTSPPGNPQMGAQWWDGTVLRVWDGAQWKIVGPGASAGPVPTTTQTFRITQPTNLNVTPNVWAIVPFTSSPSIDPMLAWNATTYQITPKRAGIYLWIVRADVSAANGFDGVALTRNDPGSVTNATEFVAISTIYTGTPTSTWLNAVGVSVMNGTTDFVRLFTFTNAGIFYGYNIPNVEGYLLP